MQLIEASTHRPRGSAAIGILGVGLLIFVVLSVVIGLVFCGDFSAAFTDRAHAAVAAFPGATAP